MAGEEICFSALDCLQLISDQTDPKDRNHKKFKVKCLLLEDGAFKCEMTLREFGIRKIFEDMSALEAKHKCAGDFWKQIMTCSPQSEVNHAFGFLREKKLVTSKPRLVSTSKKQGASQKSLEVDSELFLEEKVTFKAVGQSSDARLASLFGELSLLAQINEYFMFSPFVRWTKRKLFEINIKGAMNDAIASSEFFERFPAIGDNVFELPDGRMICLLCKQVNRSRAFALHHHPKIRKKLHAIHSCIVSNDANLASAVNRNLIVLWKDQEEIGKFVSEYKLVVIESARKTLAKHVPDLKLTLFGQSEEGMGQCYYILTINVSSSLKGQQLLDAILLSLYEAVEEFRYIQDDFNDANPNVKASHISTCLDCIFHVNHEFSAKLSKFLKYCGELSTEVATLSTLFNFWSSHCKLDLPDSGYLNPTVFPLMVIYFLQHAVAPPRFPNLHLDQFLSKGKLSAPDGSDSLEVFDAQLTLLFERARGEMGSLPPVQTWKLWLLLLQFYWIDFNYFHKVILQLKAGGDGTLLPQVREDLDKDYARLNVTNPLRGRGSNLSFSMKTHHALIYYLDCFQDTLHYYYNEVDMSQVIHSSAIQQLYPSNVKKCTGGNLYREIIITESLPAQSTKPDVGAEESDVTRTEDSPDLSMGLSINIDSSEATSDISKEVTVMSEELSLLSADVSQVADKPEKCDSNESGSNSEGEENNPLPPTTPENEESSQLQENVTSTFIVPEVLLSSKRYTLHEQDSAMELLHTTKVSDGEMNRQRERENFIRTTFTPICGLCREKGHTKVNCPKEVLPPVLPVSLPSRGNIRELNEGLLQLVDSHKMSVKESERRELLRKKLESDIRDSLDWNFDLCLFGSSVNKFGKDESDVDLCLVLQPPIEELPLDKFLTPQEMEELDPVHLLKIKKLNELANKLRETSKFVNLIPAKVPLVRFMYKLGGKVYQCDISISNSLALNNSRLLATYASFDQRVQDLGLLVKHFGKIKDLADASIGGLSSYAYILLTIHFLQRTVPPIIPVLQQIRPPGYEHSSLMVGEWECYFCDNIKAVKQTWKHKQNNQNLAELWLEFLCYCVSKFNWEKHVVTLRQLGPLHKVDKDWTNRKIGIEDPFNLKHNLGTVLSFRNAVKLRKSFIDARAFYHEPRNITDYLKWLDYSVKLRTAKLPPSPAPVEPPDAEPEPEPKQAPEPEPQPEKEPIDNFFTPSSIETVLLSWSKSLENSYTHPSYPDSGPDFIELSHTVLMPASEAAATSEPRETIPSNAIKYFPLREDVLLLSGINAMLTPEPHINGVIATPLEQRIRTSETKNPPAQHTNEPDSLSLDELTRRVAQESREIIQVPSDLSSLPFNQSLSAPHDTTLHKDMTPPGQGQHLSINSPPLPKEQDRAITASPVAQNQSPVGTNIPHGARGMQPQTSSPGYKMGRGGIRAPSLRQDESILSAHYKPHITAYQVQQDSTARAQGAQYGVHRAHHRPPRREYTDQLVEDIFSPVSSNPQRHESSLPPRGANRSAKWRGRISVTNNTQRKPHHK